jgi:DNA repair exonuclease SbcCD nuclease subunit
MKRIAIAFSDIQFHDWKSYCNKPHQRLDAHEEILKDISTRACKERLPVLFCGDWIDHPQSISNYLFSTLLNWYKKYFDTVNFYAISGNHDMSEKNTFKRRSPTYLQGFQVFKNFYCMDFYSVDTPRFRVHGIPYLNGNDGFKKALKQRRKKLATDKPNILLIHTDLPNAQEPDGRVVDSSEGIPKQMSKFFHGFDLVLSGHIHKPQQLGKNIWMLGATNQQRTSDKGTDMGFWYVLEDMSMEFVPVNYMPKFIEVEEGNKPDDDDYNLFIEIPKKTEQKEGKKLKFTNKTSKDKLVKKYMKVKEIKDKKKEKALIKALTDTEQ